MNVKDESECCDNTKKVYYVATHSLFPISNIRRIQPIAYDIKIWLIGMWRSLIANPSPPTAKNPIAVIVATEKNSVIRESV